MKPSYYDKILEAASYLRSEMPDAVQDAIVLGTGLGAFEGNIDLKKEIPYHAIPHFPRSTVQSHAGKLLLGSLKGKPVVVMSGRFHYYEGYDMKEVTFPVRVFQMLGVENFYVTNVAGGTNPDYEAGDLVMIRDHINAMPENPLRGENDDRLGPRFPDMKDTYSRMLRDKAKSSAEDLGLALKEGVYYGLPGPNLETPAEYEMIHRLGADLVGMSTVPEVLVAKHADMNIFAVSIVSNVCYPVERITETTVEEVVEVAEQAGAKLSALLTALIP